MLIYREKWSLYSLNSRFRSPAIAAIAVDIIDTVETHDSHETGCAPG